MSQLAHWITLLQADHYMASSLQSPTFAKLVVGKMKMESVIGGGFCNFMHLRLASKELVFVFASWPAGRETVEPTESSGRRWRMGAWQEGKAECEPGEKGQGRWRG